MYYNYLIENSIFQDHLSCIQLYTLCRLIVPLGSFFLTLFSSVQCNVSKLCNTCIFFFFFVLSIVVFCNKVEKKILLVYSFYGRSFYRGK